MKNLLLSTTMTLSFISTANAGTVTIVRSENISQGSLFVVLNPSKEDPMRLANGQEEHAFDVRNATYTSIGYDYRDVLEPIHCENLHIKVTNNSKHIIMLVGDMVKKTMTCTVKEG